MDWEHALGTDLLVRSTCWSFAMLERPDGAALALHSAAEADVVIIAGTGPEPVPQHVQEWLDSCLEHQMVRRAMLVGLDGGDQHHAGMRGPLCAYVASQASRWQTDFMCNEDFDERLDRDFALQFIGQRRQAPLQVNGQSEFEFSAATVTWEIPSC